MFSKRELQDVLINAILRGDVVPDRAVANDFKRKRFNRVAKALLSRNLFIPLTRKPAIENHNDVVTGYSLPLQEDVLLWGLTWTSTNTEPSSFEGRMLKINVNGRELVSNVGAGSLVLNDNDLTTAFGQMEFGYGVSNLPCPIRVPAGGRIVATFSYNPAAQFNNQVMTTGQYDSILLFCLAVKTCLSDEDRQILEICRQWIDTHEYQSPVYLNMVTPPVDSNLGIVWGGTNNGGGLDQATTVESRPVGLPVLVRALATNLMYSRIQLRDTRGHDFTPAGQFLARNLSRHAASNDAPLSVFFRLPVPHVLAPGSQLHGDLLDGTGSNLLNFDGQITAPDLGLPEFNWLTFACITP